VESSGTKGSFMACHREDYEQGDPCGLHGHLELPGEQVDSGLSELLGLQLLGEEGPGKEQVWRAERHLSHGKGSISAWYPFAVKFTPPLRLQLSFGKWTDHVYLAALSG
jgi:hypothetical protein